MGQAAEVRVRPQSDWAHALEQTLGPDYVRVRVDSMGQMRLAIFARLDTFAALHGCAARPWA